jgi:hypothetical protein
MALVLLLKELLVTVLFISRAIVKRNNTPSTIDATLCTYLISWTILRSYEDDSIDWNSIVDAVAFVDY